MRISDWSSDVCSSDLNGSAVRSPRWGCSGMRCATGWGEGAFSMSKSSGVIAPPSEAEAFFKANPNVDSIEMIYTDMGGVPRGKRLRQHEVIAVYENGRM